MAETQSLDTQELQEAEQDDSLPLDENVYGKLFGMQQYFPTVDLDKDVIVIGRNDTSDVCLNKPPCNSCPSHATYSNKHLELRRSNSDCIYVHDFSTNGTFVNGQKVGKGNKRVIVSSDRISLSVKSNFAWTFLNMKDKTSETFPQEILDRYTITRELGKGACGEVRLAFTVGDCKRYAIKIIKKKALTLSSNSGAIGNIQSEVNILKSISHPNIVNIFDVVDIPENLFIVLEFVEGGELFDRVVQAGGFEENIAKLLCYQMAEAICYLHAKGISHRDLKPENILLMDPDNTETLVKITDFGLSKFSNSETMLKTFCGTPDYLAPEIIKGNGRIAYTQQVDVWSLGLIFFICLVGYPPFHVTEDEKEKSPGENEDTQRKIYDKIVKGDVTFPKDFWSHISKNAIDVIKKMLIVKPEKRLSIQAVRDHAWFKDDDMKSKLAKLLEEYKWPDACNYLASDSRLTSSPIIKPKGKKRNGVNADDSDVKEVPVKKTKKMSTD